LLRVCIRSLRVGPGRLAMEACQLTNAVNMDDQLEDGEQKRGSEPGDSVSELRLSNARDQTLSDRSLSIERRHGRDGGVRAGPSIARANR
jgi:hypothetical protein